MSYYFLFFFCFTGFIDKLQTHPNPQLASSSSSSNQSFHLTDIILSYYPGSSNLEKKWCAFSSKSFFIQCCSTETDLDKPVKDHITPYSNIFIINLHSPYLWLKGFNSGTQTLQGLNVVSEVLQTVRQLSSNTYNKQWQKLTCSCHWEELICTWADGAKEDFFCLCKG